MSDNNHVSVCSCVKKELTSCRDPHCPIHGTPVEYVTVSSEQQGEELAKRHADELAKGLVDAIVPSIMAKCAEEFIRTFKGNTACCWYCIEQAFSGSNGERIYSLNCIECQKDWIKDWRPE